MVIDRLEEFFLAMMGRCLPISRNRYALGNLYVLLGMFFGPRWWLVPFMLVTAVPLLGYVLPDDMSGFFFILPALGASQIDLLPHRSLLLPSGRTERFFSAVVFGFAVTALSTLLLVMMAALSIPLSEIMPDIIFGGTARAFHAIDARESYLCLFLVPVGLILGTLNQRQGLDLAVVALLAQGPLLIALTSDGELTLPSLVGLPGVVSLVAASWIGFVVIMGYHCRKRSLVGQGK